MDGPCPIGGSMPVADSASGIPAAQKWVIVMTQKESTSWLTSVDPLLRSQRCRPFVSRFQKWNR